MGAFRVCITSCDDYVDFVRHLFYPLPYNRKRYWPPVESQNQLVSFEKTYQMRSLPALPLIAQPHDKIQDRRIGRGIPLTGRIVGSRVCQPVRQCDAY
jgi:hypothetical protein